jgi:hypothetical protein
MIDVTNETIKLKNKAVHQPSTVNPETILVVNWIIKTLMNSKNIPSEKIVIGIVRITKIGLIKLFRIPNTKATIIAVMESITVTPDKR